MKTLTSIRSLMACVALAAVPALFAQERPNFYGQPILDRSGETPTTGLEPALERLHQLALADDDWRAAAEKAGLTVQDDAVLVELLDINSISSFAPGAVLVMSGDTSRQRAWLRPADLNRVRATAYRAPAMNSINGEINPVSEMRADLYHAVGLTGQDVRVMVIDLGFGGLPRDVHTVQTGLSSDAEQHGAAMVEAVRAVAPGAELSAVRLDASMDVIGAVQHAIARDVKIIVCPLSWFGMPGEGQSCEAAKMAADAGILWVNAAGNFGDRRYFEGQDLPGTTIGVDTFVDFGDPYQFINGMNGGDRFSVHMACTGGLQLELYRWDGLSATFTLVEQGHSGAREQVVTHEYVEGMWYFPMVRMVNDSTASHAFRMFAVGGNLHFSDAAGSIANPTGKDVISVGAAIYGGRPALEGYSSMGGGIFDLNLDICGPSGCTTGTYGPQVFSGTSAASANIAGLLALQLADAALMHNALGMLKRIDIGGVDIAMALVDEFEPDNSADMGGAIDGATHLISPSGDQDWYTLQIDEESSIRLMADGCDMDLFDGRLGLVATGFATLEKAVVQPGSYSVRVTASGIVEYALAVELFMGAPEQVQTMSPANGAIISGDSVTLAWAPVEGMGGIIYRVEVAADADFQRMVFKCKTADNGVMLKRDEHTNLYWRVTAYNDYGAAPASDTHSLQFTVAINSISAAGQTGDTLTNVLSAGQPEGGGNDAAGCAGTHGAGSITAILAAIIAAMAIIRSRRKTA